MRNEICAFLKTNGCPTLFLTLNPYDIHHKLVHILSSSTPNNFQNLSAFDRAKQVANNPAAVAMFFDIIIKAFVNIILQHCDPCPGLFGTCNAYYDTVEAQGRGTPYCHMLVWVCGSLPPQELRDRMLTDTTFKHAMFVWLESITKCELPDMLSTLTGDLRITEPSYSTDQDPRSMDQPILPHKLDDKSCTQFELDFQHAMKDLAIACNWHQHHATCWKYLKPGEPKDNAHYYMQMNRTTHSLTELDPKTSSILLQYLHPYINNYNDLVLFLLGCNIDIKFISSGKATKALTCYVTDYITKSLLPTHLALSLLCYAIKMNQQKFPASMNPSISAICKSLITKVVNTMMACQKMLHQQIMSYLIGGCDAYTSHNFRVLNWSELDCHFQRAASIQHVPIDSNSVIVSNAQTTVVPDDVDIENAYPEASLNLTVAPDEDDNSLDLPDITNNIDNVEDLVNVSDVVVVDNVNMDVGIIDNIDMIAPLDNNVENVTVTVGPGQLMCTSLLMDYRLCSKE